MNILHPVEPITIGLTSFCVLSILLFLVALNISVYLEQVLLPVLVNCCQLCLSLTLEMITGFKSLVLLFDVRLESGGHTPLALCLHFQLPASLTLPVPVATEYAERPKPIEVSHC